MPFCLRNGIGILGWGSLAEGFLTDNFNLETLDPKDFRRRHLFGRRENYAKILKLKDVFRKIAGKHGKKIVHLVVAWELMHPALTGAIVGVRDEREAREMMGGVGWHLDEGEMEAIQDALATWEG